VGGAGLWFFNACARWHDTTAQVDNWLTIAVNDVKGPEAAFTSATYNYLNRISYDVTKLVALSEGDTVEMYVYMDSAGVSKNLQGFVASLAWCYLSGALLGASV
jgi:hypothetical protein